MRYRIIINGIGKFKVQSSPMIDTDSAWSRFWSFLRPLAWHDRGKSPSTNCHSLNWAGQEWDSLTEAREFMAECHDYDAREAKGRDWVEVLVK